MSKVAIITDSTAYFKPGEAEKLGIHVVPLGIQLGGDKFQEGVDLNSDELFHRLNYGAPYPVSVPPDITIFEKLYAELQLKQVVTTGKGPFSRISANSSCGKAAMKRRKRDLLQ